MPESHPFHLDLPTGRQICGTVTLSDLPGPRPAVIVSHGFKGFQEWGFFPSVAELLAERGFTVVRFNFPSCGMQPGDELVTDLDAFRTGTVSADLDALLSVVGSVGHRIAAGRVDRERLGLFGHSRGGGTALLAAAHPDLAGEVRALVTWAAVGTWTRLGPEETEEWRRDGVFWIENARTGQKLPIGIEVLEDLERHGEALDLTAAAQRRRAPWLLAHGGADETVPPTEADALARVAAPPFRALRIDTGDHTFGGGHPFGGPTPQLIEALNATQTWFREYLC